MRVVGLFLALLVAGTYSDPLDENFGYVDVREGAHMFWVAYHTELDGDWSEHPLILWLQGGPGASGVSYGNFQELGPYDITYTLRDYRWTKKANLMFVDNPVGTGYSYVDDPSYYTTDNAQIAQDLVTLLKSVFTDYPEMQQMPFYIYAESYGGKMTVGTALALLDAINAGEITCNFQGVSLGDSWISPMDSVNTWGSFLYNLGFVNTQEQAAIDAQAAVTQAAVDAESWVEATNEWGTTETVVLVQTGGVDFYNVHATEDIYKDITTRDGLDYTRLSKRVLNRYRRDALDDFMNSDEQRARWSIPDEVTFGSQSGDVFNYLAGDFMKPVIDDVITLLEGSEILVTVFTGNLDLICDTPGTYRWIEGMDWSGKNSFDATSRRSIVDSTGLKIGYYQHDSNFAVITFLRSGHMVPIDVPEGGFAMLDLNVQWAEDMS